MRLRALAACALALSTSLPCDKQAQGQEKPPTYKPALKDLDGHFPFDLPSSREAWEKRAAEVRQQLKTTLGVYPTPALAPLNPIVHSPKKMDGYVVEKVILESLPGLYVTGTLFRPDQPATGKRPGMLVAHGHWDNARFYDLNQKEIHRLLANGEERFYNAARNHLQAKCVQLARMGCVVFFWDMLGYCDSQQIAMRAHRYAKPTPEEATNDQGWVLFSPEAEGHYQSVIGIQTIHSSRALDFLLSLPEVDSQKIGMTGASGGGSQTFLASAIDPRIQLAFPAVMVSTGMQGGCTCENASGLRVNTGNVEIAALFAPKPLGMTAADDWTRNMHVDGFPELKKLYGLYGAADKVALFPSLHYGHNYNHISRVALYGWVNKHFQLGLSEPVLERDFEYLSGQELTVWDDQHPKPESGLIFERKLLKAWSDAATKQLLTGDASQVRGQLSGGWDVLLAPAKKQVAQLEATPGTTAGAPAYTIKSQGKALALLQEEADKNRNGSRVILQVAHGTYDTNAGYVTQPSESSMKDRELLVSIVGRPNAIVGDYYSLEDAARQPLVGNPRRSAAYTFGYNAPVRVRSVASLVKAANGYATKANQKITLWATGNDSFNAAAAAYLVPESVGSLVLVDNGSRLADAKDIDDPDFIPGSLRFQDWPGLVASLSQTKVKVVLTGKGKDRKDWKTLQDKGLLTHVEFVQGP